MTTELRICYTRRVLGTRIQEVRDRMKFAAGRAGRRLEEIRLMAVTKTRDRPTVEKAISLGLVLLGENRVQEAQDKFQPPITQAELHLIGHLQSNKARLVPGLFSWVESVDSVKIAAAISRHCSDAGTECDLLLEYNCSGEDSKFGYVDGDTLIRDAQTILRLPSIRLRGIMTIGPFTTDTDRIVRAFSMTRGIMERLRAESPGERLDTLSMGMSDDFELAIAEGSTQVRLGSVLFGARE